MTTKTPQSVLVVLLATGRQFRVPLIRTPDYVWQGGTSHDGFVTNSNAKPDCLTIDEWQWLMELIDYSINEGEDMQRDFRHDVPEDAELYPEFSYLVEFAD